MDRQIPMLARDIAHDERGAVLVEVSVVMTIMLVFLLGSIEFLFVFYQRNAAAKAVQIGARLAAVSDPVARGLNGLSVAVLGPRIPQLSPATGARPAARAAVGAVPLTSATMPRR